MFTRLVRHLALAAFGVALIALSTGCVSVASRTTAKPLSHLEVEVYGSLGYTGFSAGLLEVEGEDIDAIFGGFTVSFGARLGIADVVDIGLQAVGNLGNILLDVKYMFLDLGMFKMAVDPTVGGLFISSGGVESGFIQYELPILIDLELAEYFTLSFAPKYVGVYAFTSVDAGDASGEATDLSHHLGGSMLAQFKFGGFIVGPYGGATVWVNPPDVPDGFNEPSLLLVDGGLKLGGQF